MIAYVCMLVTVGMLASIGYDLKTINTVGIWSAYIQVYVAVCLLKFLKGKMKHA